VKWFESSCRFLDYHSFALSRDDFNEAAFLLHQAAERFYTTVLLVHTGYKPKTHDLEKLRKLADAQASQLVRAFPCASETEKTRFELLNRAYVDARYDPGYAISRDDLDYLGDRVRVLRRITEETCRAKLESLC
jgi:HEPN domain-containing protein